MKKIMFICLVFAILLLFAPVTFAKADADNYYGKIKSGDVYFYEYADTSSQIFKLPSTYFVKVESIENDFYKVTYKDLKGFVLKSDVQLMRGQLNSPYYSGTFVNMATYGLYESPNKNSNLLQLYDEEQLFNYYGSINGQQASSKGNVWYYASAVKNGETVKGYIYSQITDGIEDPIKTDNRVLEIVTENDFLTNGSSSATFTELSAGTKVILIISIALPSIFILFFLVKPSKIMKASKNQPEKKQSRKIHHGDYFEFDESDL